MEALIILGVLMFVVSLICYIVSCLWFAFRWNVCGWRPKILDKSLVEETVARYAPQAIKSLSEQIEEVHDYTLSEEQKDAAIEMVEDVFRQVIERYIRIFALKSNA